MYWKITGFGPSWSSIRTISSYRIHQEQIKKVEESLKAPYQLCHTDVLITAAPVRGLKRTKRLRQDTPNLPPPPVTGLRCLECNTRINEIDYQYTEYTGLCINCWEKQVA